MPTEPPDSAAETQRFAFRYTVFNVAATLDATHLQARSGMRTVVVPIARLQQLYVRDDRRADHVELLLTHHDAKGRLKRARLFADKKEPGFDALIEALLARRPEADVRHLSTSEAYQLSGSKELEWLALPVVMLVGWAILALLFSPLIRHGFDSGQATVEVAAFAEPHALPSRNVTVRGRLLPGSALKGNGKAAINTPGGEGNADVWWVPLVPADWQPGEAVYAVLKVRRQSPAALKRLAEGDAFDGILRNIWWEGLSERRHTAFHKRGVALASSAVLIEHEASRRSDLVIAGALLGGLLVLIVGVGFTLRRRRRATS